MSEGVDAARARLNQEPPARTAHRLRSRELADAAATLDAQATTHGARVARATLHREGLLEALRALEPEAPSAPVVLLAHLAARGGPPVLGPHEAVLRRVLESRDSVTDDGTLPLLADAHLRVLADVEAPARALAEATTRRLHTAIAAAAAIGVMVLAGGLVAAALARPRNLADGKSWRTSSVALVCHPEQHNCGGTRTDIFFHTREEQSPWLEIDLGGPTQFSGLTIQNRRDMGVGRASPLVIEASDDQSVWTPVVRRDEPFNRWVPRFAPVTARYVRLRVDKKAWFHLESVEVNP